MIFLFFWLFFFVFVFFFGLNVGMGILVSLCLVKFVCWLFIVKFLYIGLVGSGIIMGWVGWVGIDIRLVVVVIIDFGVICFLNVLFEFFKLVFRLDNVLDLLRVCCKYEDFGWFFFLLG